MKEIMSRSELVRVAFLDYPDDAIKDRLVRRALRMNEDDFLNWYKTLMPITLKPLRKFTYYLT